MKQPRPSARIYRLPKDPLPTPVRQQRLLICNYPNSIHCDWYTVRASKSDSGWVWRTYTTGEVNEDYLREIRAAWMYAPVLDPADDPSID